MTKRRPAAGEDGYVLIGALFLIVILLIGLAMAAPKIATQIRRDKELELYHRGMQYTRAIKLYYKKFQRYPTAIDQLENSNNIRFLRQRYKDPFTGKDDWRLIHFGEAKVAPTGLFGQPVGTTGSPGNTPGSGQSQSNNSLSSSSSGLSNSSSSLFNQNSSFSNQSSSFSSQSGSTSQPGTGTPTDPSQTSSTGGATGLGTSTLTSSSGSPIGSAGPIVGVASIVTKESFRELKKQKHYNEWEFVYNPQTDLGGLGGNTGQGVQQGGTPGSGLGNFSGFNGPGFSSNPGSNSGGNSDSGLNSNGSSGSNGNSGSNSNSNSGNGGSPNGNQPTDPNNPNSGNPNPTQPPQI